MKRLIAAAVVVVALGLVGAFVHAAISREREYSRLIAGGDTAFAAGRTPEALEAFSGAIAIKGESMLGYLKRGETYRRQGDLPAAFRDLQRATRLDPAAPRPLEQLGDVHYALGRFSRAAERYGDYIRLDDRSPQVLYKLALAQYREGNSAAALAALRRAVGLDPEFAEAHSLMGMALRASGRFREASVELERAVALAPALTPAREELAAVYRRLGRTSGETEQLEALAALQPARAERQLALALLHSRLGRTDLAAATLARAADRFPNQPKLNIALARVWLDSANEQGTHAALERAIGILESATASGPDDGEALTLLGRAWLLGGRADLAVPVLQRATAVFPVELPAFLLLAEAATATGDHQIARDALVGYVTLGGTQIDDTRRAALAIRIGDESGRLGDLQSAVTWYRRGLGQAGADAALLGRIAEAEWKTGRTDRARELLERALTLEPDAPRLLALRNAFSAPTRKATTTRP